MAKSNGIKSLKQAAKLLNKHSPDGESLAYINPEEARLLRSHGGSGIMTVAGVPSYLPDWMTDIWTGVKNVGSNILGRYTDPDKGGGNVIKDLASLWGGYEGMKEAKELTQWERDQYEIQRAKEALNEIRFAQQTDSGAQLLAPQNVASSISDVSAYRPIDFSGSATPDLTTTAVAQGGRIGAFNGGIQGLMPQQGMPQQGLMPQQGFMPPQGLDPRMGYAAQGGRIGYQEAGAVDELAGLKDPFVPGRIDKEGEGFYQDEFTGMRDPFKPSGEMQEIQKDYDIESMRDPFKPSGEMQEIMSLVQSLMMTGRYEMNEAIDMVKKMLQDVQNQGRAQGGRIGAQGGGIMPLLDMGGMEKDYRQDGGFVPIGRKEKADDVPARLSKNEFVFTADAVKAAGGGDIDEGAQRMYNVMKNLEAGGEISEQSQGQA